VRRVFIRGTLSVAWAPVKPLLSPSAFITLAVGIPWERWRSDWKSVDCFGLVLLYHREVLGLDLGTVPQTDIAAGFAASPGWVECAPDAASACFMAFKDGSPTHCGVALPGGQVLHCPGAPDRPGSVQVTRRAVVEKVYGPLKYYRFEAAPC